MKRIKVETAKTIPGTKLGMAGIKESIFKIKQVRVGMAESISGMKSAMVGTAEIVSG